MFVGSIHGIEAEKNKIEKIVLIISKGGVRMKIFLMHITLRASWVHSLKEKRMVVKSLIQRIKNKYNVSVSEVAEQDIHQTIVIGIAGIGGTSAIVDSTMENIIEFIEGNTEAEIIGIEQEVEVYTF